MTLFWTLRQRYVSSMPRSFYTPCGVTLFWTMRYWYAGNRAITFLYALWRDLVLDRDRGRDRALAGVSIRLVA